MKSKNKSPEHLKLMSNAIYCSDEGLQWAKSRKERLAAEKHARDLKEAKLKDSEDGEELRKCREELELCRKALEQKNKELLENKHLCSEIFSWSKAFIAGTSIFMFTLVKTMVLLVAGIVSSILKA